MTRLIQDLSSLCQMVPVNLCLLAAWKNASWDRFVLLAQEVPTPCLPCLCVPNTLCSCWSLFLNQGVHLSPYTSEIADIRLLRTCVAHCTLQLILWLFLAASSFSLLKQAAREVLCGLLFVDHVWPCVCRNLHIVFGRITDWKREKKVRALFLRCLFSGAELP